MGEGAGTTCRTHEYMQMVNRSQKRYNVKSNCCNRFRKQINKRTHKHTSLYTHTSIYKINTLQSRKVRNAKQK